METGTVVVSSFITVSFAVIGWFLYRLGASFSVGLASLKTDIRTVKTDSNIAISSVDAAAKKSVEGLANRLDKEIGNVKDTVVFKDVFEQHQKLEDSRHESVQQMQEVIKEQLKGAATQNATEHDRICGKMDAIPQIIREEIRDRMNGKR